MGFPKLLMILTITVSSFSVAVFFFRQWNQPNRVVANQEAETLRQRKKDMANEVRVFEHSEAGSFEMYASSTCVVWGRHPLLSVEEKVPGRMDRFLELFIVSRLDDILFQYYGGDKVKGLFTRLGHRPGECIEESLISESIRRA